MIIAHSLDELQGSLTSACVTIGNFDGVHRGHQKLLSRTREKAKACGSQALALTFDPHPLQVLAPDHAPPFITLTDQKLCLIEGQGMDACLVLPFTREMAALAPEDFVKTYLVDGLHMHQMVIGYDYAFGKGRKGNFDVLKKLGEKYDFSVERVGPYMYEDAVVSSTRIRDMVRAGKVWEAKPLLGRFYTVKGTILHGANRGGRLLGYPTANLRLEDELQPALGVYAVWATFKGHTYPAVANIGYNPTFGNNALSVEVHIMNFDQDVYGQELCVQFVQRLRSEKKFSGIDELREHIAKDTNLARTILASSQAQA